MSRTRKLAITAILAAVALCVYVLEAQIPAPIPVPGVKLGLANVVTLAAMLLLGRKQALAVLVVRLLLGSVFSGGFSAFLYSAVGGALAFAVMASLIGVMPLWAVSALAAIAHNLGQLVVAVLITGAPGLFWYAPALLLAAILTGVFTGLAAQYLSKSLKGRIR